MNDQADTGVPVNSGVFRGHEFEALKCRFEDQVELLHRLTLHDYRVFSGYITLQLALGAWVATQGTNLAAGSPRTGLMLIDLALATIAGALLYNNYKRRKEVTDTVHNCSIALGYETTGVYLAGKTLNAPTKFRPWVPWYLAGIVLAFVGIVFVVFGTGTRPC